MAWGWEVPAQAWSSFVLDEGTKWEGKDTPNYPFSLDFSLADPLGLR